MTKDNMTKRKWTGNPTCVFCNQLETRDHLFFQCSVARCVWGTVAMCFGANNIPSNIQQYKWWIQKLIPMGGPSITLALQRYVGLFGRDEIELCLTRRLFVIQLR
jgi:hypothetical protein